MTTTPYMLIDLPTNSSSTSLGTFAQDWANMINVGFSTIDQHDHSPDFGNLILSSSLNFNNLNLNDYSFFNVSYLNFHNDEESDAVFPYSLFVLGGELYYKTTSANVQITDAGSLAIAQVGGFVGDYRTDGSLVAFYGETESFVFYGASAADFADIECGDFNVSSVITFETFSGYLNATGDITFTSSEMKNKVPQANSGAFIGAYSDLSDTFDTVTDTYYARYRDQHGGLSWPIATINHTITTITFLNFDSSTNSQKYFGGMDKGFRRLGYNNTDKRKLALRFELDVDFGQLGGTQNTWEEIGQTPQGLTLFQKIVNLEENSNDVVIFSRKPFFYLQPTENFLYTSFLAPYFNLIETNYGTYKEFKMQSTLPFYTYSDGGKFLVYSKIYLQTLKGVYLSDS